MTEDQAQAAADCLPRFEGHDYVEGGPQGRFIVHRYKVYGLADLYGIPDVQSMVGHLKTNGMSLSNFLDQIIQSK